MKFLLLFVLMPFINIVSQDLSIQHLNLKYENYALYADWDEDYTGDINKYYIFYAQSTRPELFDAFHFVNGASYDDVKDFWRTTVLDNYVYIIQNTNIVDSTWIRIGVMAESDSTKGVLYIKQILAKTISSPSNVGIKK